MSEEKMIAASVTPPDYARGTINLADGRLGTEPLAVSDEFFAEAARMLDHCAPVFYPDRYDEHGKWMDGWETRRRRNGGHDWCVIKLGLPGIVYGVDMDTSFFTGNFPPAGSLEACYADGGEPAQDTEWVEILPVTTLEGNAHHFREVRDRRIWTHLRLNIYPDGGIARLRVYGRARPDWSRKARKELHDLAALACGGRVVAVSNAHYGDPSPLLAPGRGINMGDGWETRRRREPGNDWAIIELGHPGEIRRVEVDTAHFKGNFPDRCSIQGAFVPRATDESLVTQSMFWGTLLAEHPLRADHLHVFDAESLSATETITHVRFNIIPDGGVSRLRLFGVPHD